MLRNPCIIVIGNANPDYETRVIDVAQCRSAAREIGRELASSGCHLIVHTADPRYIEYDVVEGYASAQVKGPRKVTLRFAEDSNVRDFPDDWFGDVAVRKEANNDSDWEVDFFNSLIGADGIILIGGGHFVFVSGLVALSLQLPLAPVATLGGAAYHVWRTLAKSSPSEAALLSASDIRCMRELRWTANSAKNMVSLLLKQQHLKEQQKEESHRDLRRSGRRRLFAAVSAIGLLIAAVLLLVSGLTVLSSGVGAFGYYAALLVPPILAGAAGSSLRAVYSRARSNDCARNVALGFGAGGIAALLFTISQLATSASLLTPDVAGAVDQGKRLLFFAWVVGVIAGFTSDTVFAKLRNADVTRLEPLSPDSKGAPFGTDSE
jgi:hypothetical protein